MRLGPGVVSPERVLSGAGICYVGVTAVRISFSPNQKRRFRAFPWTAAAVSLRPDQKKECP